MRLTFSVSLVVVFTVALALQTVALDALGTVKDNKNKATGVRDVSLAEFFPELKNQLSKYFAGLLNFDIGFYLYTPSNLREGYRLQLNQSSLKDSPFDPSLKTKMLIHGYSVSLPPESVFFDIKDEILHEGNYNVIVVNWTKYNHGDYASASSNAVIVGIDIGKLIQFLMDNTGISAESVHLIGHSLGAHVAAFAGKTTENLGRITGLDAAGPLFEALPTNLKLWYTDAIFVDAMHTNGALLIAEGFGTLGAYGDLDFYPNGGSKQPRCSSNDTYLDTEENVRYANTTTSKISCSHDRAPFLFLESISKCTFHSVYCRSYWEFQQRMCPRKTKSPSQGLIVTKMGFHANPYPSLPPRSKFFLRTGGQPPYCN